MSKVSGIYLGTAATMNLGLGFIPSYFRMMNLNDFIAVEWFLNGGAYGTSKAYYGVSVAAAGDTAAITSAAYGVVPYKGGDVITTASTTYLVRDDRDQRASYSSTSPATTFTVGTISGNQGNFDHEVHTDTVGPGSKICINGEWFEILTMGSNGEAANETDLDALPTGAAVGSVYPVSKITSRYGWLSAPKGVTMPRGVTIGASNVAHTGYPVKFWATDDY